MVSRSVIYGAPNLKGMGAMERERYYSALYNDKHWASCHGTGRDRRPLRVGPVCSCAQCASGLSSKIM